MNYTEQCLYFAYRDGGYLMERTELSELFDTYAPLLGGLLQESGYSVAKPNLTIE